MCVNLLAENPVCGYMQQKHVKKSCLWVHTKIVLLKTHIELQIFIKKLFLAASQAFRGEQTGTFLVVFFLKYPRTGTNYIIYMHIPTGEHFQFEAKEKRG